MNVKLLFPDISWISELKQMGMRGDLIAGLTGFLLAFPQGIALATVAGLPPVYGLYASVFPLIIAALWGSSRLSIGGANTAMSMLMIAAATPFAIPGSEAYLSIVLILTLAAGLIQLVIGMLSLGRILDFISSTVVAALIMAVAINMFFAVIPDVIGSNTSASGPVFKRLLQLPAVFNEFKTPEFIIGIITLSLGVLMNQIDKRFAFLLAIIGGTLAFYLLTTFSGSSFEQLSMLAPIDFQLNALTLPDLTHLSLDENTLLSLGISAFSLAVLGMTQSVVIARSASQETGQDIDANREISGQGIANIVAAFTHGYSVSSSFSGSATNRMAGAKTPFAAIIIGVLILLAALFAGQLISLIPKAVMAGGILVIAISMFKPDQFKSFRHPTHEFTVFLITLLSALGFGLIVGVMAGVILSALVYLWKTAQPNIQIENQTGSDGRPLHLMTIKGSLFFGAVQSVENALQQLSEKKGRTSTLIIRTDQVGYIDTPGIRLLTAECARRLKAGGDFYLYIIRDAVYEQFKSAHLLDDIGKKRIIRPFTSHPIQAVMQPLLQKTDNKREAHTSILHMLEPKVRQEIEKRLQYKHLSNGDVLVKQGSKPDGYYILQEGEASVQRYSLLDGNTHHIATLQTGDSFGEEGLLQGNTRNASIRMKTDGRIAFLSKQHFEELLRPILAPEITLKAAQEKVIEKQASWLDCRFETEFENDHLENALSLPLNQIRARSHELSQELEYIVYCDKGQRSLSATFLLRERGFKAFHLVDGYQKLS